MNQNAKVIPKTNSASPVRAHPVKVRLPKRENLSMSHLRPASVNALAAINASAPWTRTPTVLTGLAPIPRKMLKVSANTATEAVTRKIAINVESRLNQVCFAFARSASFHHQELSSRLALRRQLSRVSLPTIESNFGANSTSRLSAFMIVLTAAEVGRFVSSRHVPATLSRRIRAGKATAEN